MLGAYATFLEGGIGGYPIPHEKKANTEIPRRKSTKYRYRIFQLHL